MFLNLLKEEGQGLPRTVTYPCCLYQVSVNPGYQASELEYTLKKVGPIPGVWGQVSTWHRGLIEWGGHAQMGDTQSLSFFRLWEGVGGGGGWADTRLVYVWGWCMHVSWW